MKPKIIIAKNASLYICDTNENLYEEDGKIYQPHNVGFVDSDDHENEYQFDLNPTDSREEKISTILNLLSDVLEEDGVNSATVTYIDSGDEDGGNKISL